LKGRDWSTLKWLANILVHAYLKHCCTYLIHVPWVFCSAS
jgi:hypothetical protein